MRSSNDFYQFERCSKCGHAIDKFSGPTEIAAKQQCDFYSDKPFGLWRSSAIGELLAYEGATQGFCFRKAAFFLLGLESDEEPLVPSEKDLLIRWADGEKNPNFIQFLALCYRSGVYPLDVLNGCILEDRSSVA